MKYILTDKDNIILSIGNTATTDTDNVIWIDGAGYALFGQTLHEVATVPDNVIPNYYKYTNNKFTAYTSAIDILRAEAIDTYTIQLLEEGVI